MHGPPVLFGFYPQTLIHFLIFRLAKERKKRTPVETLATPDDLTKLKEKSSVTGLHATSPAGILSLDIHPDQRRILTGGNDKNVVVSDRESETILSTLKGHTKKITSVLFHPTEDVLFSSSADKTVRIWTHQKDSNIFLSSLVHVHKSKLIIQ